MIVSLNKLAPSESAVVVSIGVKGSLRRKLMDMGITPGASVTMRKTAPLGDPVELHLRGYSLSIRKAEADQVMVEM